MIAIAHAQVIENAPTVATVLLRILEWLLLIFGFFGILALVFSGVLYFMAVGDASRIESAKKAFGWSVAGIAVGVGSLVLVKTMARFLMEQ